MKSILTLFLTAFIPAIMSAQYPAHVTWLDIEPNGSVSAEGNLNTGKQIELRFASRSTVACFPATQNDKFSGKHVFYALRMPAHSELTITATPRNGRTDVNLYAIQTSVGNASAVPPATVSCVSCEASFSYQGNNPGDEEQVELQSVNNEYDVIIGIAGPAGVTEGDFTLKAELITRRADIAAGPGSATNLDVASGVPVRVTGNLSEGAPMRLDWASYSTMACFPATQNENFRGNHVLYRFKLPAYSEVEIKAVPGRGQDVSLYAIQIGADNMALPPEISSCVSCESSFDYRNPNPDETESVKLNAIRNDYTVVVGVAGREGENADYILEIDLKTNRPEDEQIAVGHRTIYQLEIEQGQSLAWQGNLKDGQPIPLGWAESSQVACFPATQFENFRGNHVFYQVELPAYSTMKVTVVPKSGEHVNVYGMTFGKGNPRIPPEVSSANCEASYPYKESEAPKERSIDFLALRNPYTVVIGVAGPRGVTESDYELRIELKSR